MDSVGFAQCMAVISFLLASGILVFGLYLLAQIGFALVCTPDGLSTVLVFCLLGRWETRKSSCQAHLGIVTREVCVVVYFGVGSEDQILFLL